MTGSPLPTTPALLDAVSTALADLITWDEVLLDLAAHELSIVHRFGVYLEQRLAPQIIEHGLAVDLDYDRHGYLEKVLPEKPDRDGTGRFRPDLIVHRRLDDEANLLVVEWKKGANSRIVTLMRERVKSLLVADSFSSEYGYQVGVIVDSGEWGVRWQAFTGSGPATRWRRVSRS